MAKYLVETFYTCSFKVSHYLDDINENEIKALEKRDEISNQYSLIKKKINPLLIIQLPDVKTEQETEQVTDETEESSEVEEPPSNSISHLKVR